MKRSISTSEFAKILSGGDMRSTGCSDHVVSICHDQRNFDSLFQCLYNVDMIVVMRAADAIEKITIDHPNYLNRHKGAILALSTIAENKELQWHLALIIPRLDLKETECNASWKLLKTWLFAKEKSRIVRVNALQGLSDISRFHPQLNGEFKEIISELEKENTPSLRARIRRILNTTSKPG